MQCCMPHVIPHPVHVSRATRPRISRRRFITRASKGEGSDDPNQPPQEYTPPQEATPSNPDTPDTPPSPLPAAAATNSSSAAGNGANAANASNGSPSEAAAAPAKPANPLLAEFLTEIEKEKETPVDQPTAAALVADADEPSKGGLSWKGVKESGILTKMAIVIGLVALVRLGSYIHLPGVDIQEYKAAIERGDDSQKNPLLMVIDQLSGGSLSRVSIFALGIIPYINASILMQLLSTIWPSLKKMQREDGPQGRARFTLYTKLAALFFAVLQSFAQLSSVRPYVSDFGQQWLITSVALLTGGAMIQAYIGEIMTEQKLGNGTSILIFESIASSIPASLTQMYKADGSNSGQFAIAMAIFLVTTGGIVFVTEGERRIPINYATRYSESSIKPDKSFMPLKVNGAGVMPVIFASSVVSLPAAIASFLDLEILNAMAKGVGPNGTYYLPFIVVLILFFNYYYTFLQFDPVDLSEQLKKGGASVPNVRPGRATAEYMTTTLNRLSVLGSVFLAVLAATPLAIEYFTDIKAYRGFFGTSLLILVGVATDFTRRIRAEQAMGKYRDLDKIYKDIDSLA